MQGYLHKWWGHVFWSAQGSWRNFFIKNKLVNQLIKINNNNNNLKKFNFFFCLVDDNLPSSQKIINSSQLL
jgi:hypothetical protein